MRVALLVAMMCAGCTFDPRLPPDVTVQCTQDADCPTGGRCQTSQHRCVAQSELDVTAPFIDGVVAVRFLPHAENRVAAPTALGPLTDVELSFAVSEVLSEDPRLAFSPELGVACVTRRESPRQYQLRCTAPVQHGLETTLDLRATLVDERALEATVTLAQLPYDDLAPEAPDTVTPDSVVLRHLPWGDRLDEKSRSTAVLAPGLGAAYAELWTGSTNLVVALVAGQPTRAEVPLSIGPASIRLLDAAGNASPASVVHWFEWVASPRSTAFTQSPHQVAAYSVFPPAPLSPRSTDAGDPRDLWLIDGTHARLAPGVAVDHYGLSAGPIDFLRGTSADSPVHTFVDAPLGEPTDLPDGAVRFFGNTLHEGLTWLPSVSLYEPWSRRAVTTLLVDGGHGVFGCFFDAGCTRLGVLPEADALASTVDVVGQRTHLATAKLGDAGLEVAAFRVGAARVQRVSRAALPTDPLGEPVDSSLYATLGPRGESVRLSVTTRGRLTSTDTLFALALTDASVPDAAIESVLWNPYSREAYTLNGNNVESPRRRTPCAQPFAFSATGETWCAGQTAQLRDGGLVALLSLDGGQPLPNQVAQLCTTERCLAPLFRGATGLARSWSSNELYLAADAGPGALGLFAVVDDQASLVSEFPPELTTRFFTRLRAVPHPDGPVWLDATPSVAARRVFRLVGTSLVELWPLPTNVTSMYTDPRGHLFALNTSSQLQLTDAGWSTRPVVGGAVSNVTWDPVADRPVGFGGELSFGRERPGFVFVVDPSWFQVPETATLVQVQFDVEGGALGSAEDGGTRAGLELGAWTSALFWPGAYNEHTPSRLGPASLTLKGAALEGLTTFYERWAFGVRPAGTNGEPGAEFALDGLDVSARYFVP